MNDRHSKLLDEHFTDGNIKSCLSDFILILDEYRVIRDGSHTANGVNSMLATALFQHMNNPFSMVFGPVLRVIILDILRRDPRNIVDEFLTMAVPLAKTIQNGHTPRDYFKEYEAVKGAL